MDKQYLQIDGLVFREDGWTEDDETTFTNELIELIEKHNGQAGLGFQLKSEEELEEEDEEFREE